MALVFVLLAASVRSPDMLKRMTWLIVVAMGYIAVRGALDYARGINLERGRLMGSVSGLMGNPNDLAMNMVTFMPFALVAALARGPVMRRLIATGASAFMGLTIVLTRSRAGMLGLVVMAVVLLIQSGRLRGRMLMVLLFAGILATPITPPSIWTRLSSIFIEEQDETGSRESRLHLMRQGWETFLEFPVTGVGVGQFKNYNPPGRQEAWQETHNVILQILAELGIAGGVVFLFLLACPVVALSRTKRLLRRLAPAGGMAALSAGEADWMRIQVGAAAAGFAGWVTCAQFASVGYYWTFYYLLAFIVAGREILVERLRAVRRAAMTAPRGGVAA
ncbi:MAG: O-antigen ligase family protein [Vicinamibacterales bacterium]